MTDLPNGHDRLAKANSSFPITYSAKPRFVVVGEWLEHDGAQILAGPPAVLEQFADHLNLLNPPRHVLARVLRALICQTRGSIFTYGEAVRRMWREAAP
jgi:hypothetical protein